MIFENHDETGLDLNRTLDELLDRGIESIASSLSAEYPRPCEGRPLVLFGSASLGRKALAGLRRAGVVPLAFCDNKASCWGQDVDGIPILAPIEAVSRYGQEAVFAVTLYNPSAAVTQLEALGADCVVTAAVLFRHFHEDFLDASPAGLPYEIYRQAEFVREAEQLWADEESRREYLAQIIWRTTLWYPHMPPARPLDEMYFPPDLVQILPDESFVDCGAADGDTLRAFLRVSGGVFARFDALDADAQHCTRLKAFSTLLPGGTFERIHIRRANVGRGNAAAPFWDEADESVVLGLQDQGAVTDVCLDKLLSAARPSFIKMDVGGAELDAIEGARDIIRNDCPALAISVWHAMDHLWRIPLLLRELYPDYKFYLRRYAEECWETVCYAIPPGRFYDENVHKRHRRRASSNREWL
jgi:FkbM family methyltransferase